MKSRDALIKSLARQETKIDNALKVKPNQNQNKEHMFKVTNPIIQFLKAWKLQLTGKLNLLWVNLTIDQRQNLDNEARQKLCWKKKETKKLEYFVKTWLMKQKRNCMEMIWKEKKKKLYRTAKQIIKTIC